MADNKVYEDVMKLRTYVKEYYEFTKRQGHWLQAQIDADEPKVYSSYETQFLEWTSRIDICYSMIEALDEIIKNFPEMAKVIYDD